MDTDVIIIGAGLSGLVTAYELTKAGKKVTIVDQETKENLGGQAFWSFGGLFLVNSPEQRKLRIKDSFDLAWQDWQGSAGWDRGIDNPQGQDYWAHKWARKYVEFASEEKRSWLKQIGIKIFPIVGWAERGGSLATGHGNSVPRFHITWGTGPGIIEPFVKSALKAQEEGLLEFKFRHQVIELITENNQVIGISGNILKPDNKERGYDTNREVESDFNLKASAVVIASGGIGANHDLVKANWPKRLGEPPKNIISGVPAYVDGKMLEISEDAGARIVNPDRMWHYTEGIKNWNPIWSNHGIRIIPGPTSIWLNSEGERLGAPNFPGFDTLSTLKEITKNGSDYSWFILNHKIIQKEFALSGSEQNPDLTDRKILDVIKRGKKIPTPIQKFIDHGVDFITANNIEELVTKMNQLTESNLDSRKIENEIIARDKELTNKFSKDAQIIAINNARKNFSDKLFRTSPPNKILDPKNGPLIAVRLNILSRKTLGGLQTNLDGNVLNQDAEPIKGLYAVGEVAGFGGGGIHGYNALEGTFLGNCLFTGKQTGKAISTQI